MEINKEYTLSQAVTYLAERGITVAQRTLQQQVKRGSLPARKVPPDAVRGLHLISQEVLDSYRLPPRGQPNKLTGRVKIMMCKNCEDHEVNPAYGNYCSESCQYQAEAVKSGEVEDWDYASAPAQSLEQEREALEHFSNNQ